ncbi:MAG TPA: oxygenase MpaB family protein [Acidimicrobiales bacterium]|nr:oxygenase MpaB family protein [Acidimicrobiales bacterium]
MTVEALLGPDTVSARLLGHPGLLLGGPRALLLQVAHPGVAAGVAQHSDFASDPFGRLTRTLKVMDRIAFGRPEQAAAALAGLDAVHRRVAGVRPDGVAYSADDPELVLWVHATLIDTVLRVDARYLGILDEPARRRFYEESMLLAAAFHLPEVPGDLDAFRRYMAAALDRVEVGDDARRIAGQVIRPSFGAVLGPAGSVLGLLSAPLLEAVTADLLPSRLRRAYGLRRGAGLPPAAVALQVAATLSRLVSPRLPAALTRPGTLARATVPFHPGHGGAARPRQVGGRSSPANSARQRPGRASTNGKSTTAPVPRSQ